jgi:hypothetical protein
MSDLDKILAELQAEYASKDKPQPPNKSTSTAAKQSAAEKLDPATEALIASLRQDISSPSAPPPHRAPPVNVLPSAREESLIASLRAEAEAEARRHAAAAAETERLHQRRAAAAQAAAQAEYQRQAAAAEAQARAAEAQARAAEAERLRTIEQARAREQQEAQARQAERLKKAEAWLKQLKPKSDDGKFFEAFARDYPSRLEAAVAYLDAMEDLDHLGKVE